jgi:hypothetical protein
VDGVIVGLAMFTSASRQRHARRTSLLILLAVEAETGKQIVPLVEKLIVVIIDSFHMQWALLK